MSHSQLTKYIMDKYKYIYIYKIAKEMPVGKWVKLATEVHGDLYWHVTVIGYGAQMIATMTCWMRPIKGGK